MVLGKVDRNKEVGYEGVGGGNRVIDGEEGGGGEGNKEEGGRGMVE